jgi:hypothetical protein
MVVILNEKDLPAELTLEQSVEPAHAHELAEAAPEPNLGGPCLIESDKHLAPFACLNLRTLFHKYNMNGKLYLDSRQRGNE